MNSLENNLISFDAIGLENLNSIELMKRHDTKYLFHKDKLYSVLQYLNDYYSILEINGRRNFQYETVYYDTDDYFFYRQHHNQRLNRYKVRCRKYIESDKRYFEVKFKNNKRKTIKTRYQLQNDDFSNELSEESKHFAGKHFLHKDKAVIDSIKPKLRVDYCRITLASQQLKERVTFDTNLTYVDKNAYIHKLNNLVIVELKQETVSRESPIIKCFRDLRILPSNFSKYCMGVAMTENGVKTNRFKKKLLYLQKLE